MSAASDVADLLLVGFDGFLRNGELFTLQPNDADFAYNKAILCLRDTKTGQRLGKYETVILKDGIALRWLRMVCRTTDRSSPILKRSPVKARALLVAL